MSVRRTSVGAMPCASLVRPRMPYSGLTSAWVDSAPTPLSAYGQSAPTAKNRLATITPRAPDASRATIDQVMAHCESLPGAWQCDPAGDLRQRLRVRRDARRGHRLA